MDAPMPRTKGFRQLPREKQLRQFYYWLPPELHSAPDIRWEDLPTEVMAYCVRVVGESLDAAPLAVAAAAMIGRSQTVTQVQTLGLLARLLATLRASGNMTCIADLSKEPTWRSFVANSERKTARYKQLASYSVASKSASSYLLRLSSDDRQHMRQYTLPALPPGFVMQVSGDAQTEAIVAVTDHCTLEQIDGKIQGAHQKFLRRRWEIVRTALAHPRPVATIAADVGTSPQLVLDVLTSYNRGGVSALETQGQGGGRRHSYLNEEEERAFMTPFLQRAQAGDGISFREAREAFEARVGQKVNATTVYRLFHKYGMHAFTHSQKSRSRQGKADGSTSADR
jgi:transposase